MARMFLFFMQQFKFLKNIYSPSVQTFCFFLIISCTALQSRDIKFYPDQQYKGEEVGFYLYVGIHKLEEMMDESNKSKEEIMNQLIQENIKEWPICTTGYKIYERGGYEGGDVIYKKHCLEPRKN